jgi:FAD binding domain
MRGPVLTPEHPAYEVARTTFNAMIDRAPAVIACCAGSDDVAAAIAWAQQEGLPMAIRGGGHSVAGHSICSGGLLIDLRLMGGVLIDPESRRARVGGGATWRSVDACSAVHRLAMLGGTFDTTGVAGLTLGGGIGHLIGLHGLTLDNLESAEVILADGTVVPASNTVEPELFLGVARWRRELRRRDRIRVQAAPVASRLGRNHHLCAASGGGRRPAFRDVMATAPDELTMMCYLDHEGVPDGAAYVTVCFVGDTGDAEEAIRPLREHLPVLRDGLGLTSYLQIQAMQGDTPFGLRHYWKSHFVESLPDELIDQIVEQYFAHPADGWDVVLFEPMHGAATRVSASATAFGRRRTGPAVPAR